MTPRAAVKCRSNVNRLSLFYLFPQCSQQQLQRNENVCAGKLETYPSRRKQKRDTRNRTSRDMVLQTVPQLRHRESSGVSAQNPPPGVLSEMGMLRQSSRVEYDRYVCQPRQSGHSRVAVEEILIGGSPFHLLVPSPQSSKHVRVNWGSRSGRMLLPFSYVAGVKRTKNVATYQNGFLLSGE